MNDTRYTKTSAWDGRARAHSHVVSVSVCIGILLVLSGVAVVQHVTFEGTFHVNEYTLHMDVRQRNNTQKRIYIKLKLMCNTRQSTRQTRERTQIRKIPHGNGGKRITIRSYFRFYNIFFPSPSCLNALCSIFNFPFYFAFVHTFYVISMQLATVSLWPCLPLIYFDIR